jgi:hypothetical protein
MTDIAMTLALEMVEDGLRQDVLPLVADSNAAAALRAAVAIVGNVRAELESNQGWRREVLAEALPLADRWPEAIRATAPDTADQVARHLDRARSLTDSARAHEHLLAAAQCCLVELWRHHEPDRELLAALRRVTRRDAEARAAVAR